MICISLIVGGSACSPPEDLTWKRIQATGVMRVGMNAGFPPFEFVASDGTLSGFDVDLARELGRRLGVDVQFVANLPYDGLYDALTAERVDVVVSALVVDSARMADVAYSRSYFDAGPVLAVADDRTDIRKMADLSGCKVSVALGTQADMEARKWARRLVDLDVQPRQTAAEALKDVAAKNADAALVDHVSARQAIDDGVDVAIVGKPVVEVPYAAAVRKDSPRLLEAIDEALSEMSADGTLGSLKTEWLGEER